MATLLNVVMLVAYKKEVYVWFLRNLDSRNLIVVYFIWIGPWPKSRPLYFPLNRSNRTYVSTSSCSKSHTSMQTFDLNNMSTNQLLVRPATEPTVDCVLTGHLVVIIIVLLICNFLRNFISAYLEVYVPVCVIPIN